MNKIISITPESAITLLRLRVLPNIHTVMSVLVECPDATVRSALSEVLTQLVLVSINSAKIYIRETDERPINDNLVDPTDEEVIKLILKRLFSVFRTDKKDSGYKKHRGLFKMWDVLVHSSNHVLMWLVKKNKVVERLFSMIL